MPNKTRKDVTPFNNDQVLRVKSNKEEIGAKPTYPTLQSQQLLETNK